MFVLQFCSHHVSTDGATAATWAMKDLLVPFIHYISISLSNDYSNLLQMIKWANANEHDDACQEISQSVSNHKVRYDYVLYRLIITTAITIINNI